MNINHEENQFFQTILVKYFERENLNPQKFILKLIDGETLEEHELRLTEAPKFIRIPDFVLVPDSLEAEQGIEKMLKNFQKQQNNLVKKENTAWKNFQLAVTDKDNHPDDFSRKEFYEESYEKLSQKRVNLRKFEKDFFITLQSKCKKEFDSHYFELPCLENFPNDFTWNIVKNNFLKASLKFNFNLSFRKECDSLSYAIGKEINTKSFYYLSGRLFSLERCYNDSIYIFLAADYSTGVRVKVSDAEYLILKYKYDTRLEQMRPDSFFMPNTTNFLYVGDYKLSYESSNLKNDFPLESTNCKFPITRRVFYEEFLKPSNF